MTRDEAVALIQEKLGFRTDLASNIITHLKFAQTILESSPTKPWFLVSEDAYRRTETGEERLPIPEDFLEEAEEAVLRYVPDEDDDDDDDTSNQVDLVKEDYDQLRKNFATDVTGPPEAYALFGDYFRIFPTPDDEYLIRMIYYVQDEILDSNIENKWLQHAPLLLMGKAGKEIAGSLRDSVAAAEFSRWEQEGRLLLFTKEESRKHVNRNYQIGGPHV